MPLSAPTPNYQNIPSQPIRDNIFRSHFGQVNERVRVLRANLQQRALNFQFQKPRVFIVNKGGTPINSDLKLQRSHGPLRQWTLGWQL